MFEQIFKNVDDILWKDAGCGSELDYVEQTSWVLFLKYLDDLEREKNVAAELAGKTYESIISPEFRWSVWAVPKGKDGKLDHHKAMTGDDLIDFELKKGIIKANLVYNLNNKLFLFGGVQNIDKDTAEQYLIEEGLQ